MSGRYKWDINSSESASNTKNPIRSIIENMDLKPNPNKPFIALTIGDPTVFGNLSVSSVAVDALVEVVKSSKYNGYVNSMGLETAREAVAKYSSTGAVYYAAEDVILTSGCSSALESCISCLANPGQNILLPKPGFSIYKTIMDDRGIDVKYYDLQPNKGWEVDLDNLKEQIDKNTVAIIINNPSNPCGSVYSRHHLEDILEIARTNFLPIISDEVYEYMVFEGQEFIPMAELSNDVPVLTCSGLTKRFLVPGWRIGWVNIHDPLGVLEKKVRPGLVALNQKTLGCNTLVQGAIPKILTEIPDTFFKKTNNMIERHARIAYEHLARVKGLRPIMPQGSMYMMVGVDLSHFPAFLSELQFLEQMVAEESVLCLPGSCFNYPGYVRIVLTVPEDKIAEACQRIEDFCHRYYVDNVNLSVTELKKKMRMKFNNYITTENKSKQVV